MQRPAGQLGRQHYAPLAEWVQRQRAFVGLDAQQEVAGEIHAAHLQAAAPGGVQVEHAERHRNALAPLAHRQDVGVVGMVVGHQVASQAQVAGHGLGQGFLGGLVGQPLLQPVGPFFGQRPSDRGIAGRILVHRARHRGLEQRKGVIPRTPRLA